MKQSQSFAVPFNKPGQIERQVNPNKSVEPNWLKRQSLCKVQRLNLAWYLNAGPLPFYFVFESIFIV